MTILETKNFTKYQHNAIEEMLQDNAVEEYIELNTIMKQDNEPLYEFVKDMASLFTEAFNGVYFEDRYSNMSCYLPLTYNTEAFICEVWDNRHYMLSGLAEEDKSTLYRTINGILGDYLTDDRYTGCKLSEEIDSYYEYEYNILMEYLQDTENLTEQQAQHCIYNEHMYDARSRGYCTDKELNKAMLQAYYKDNDGEWIQKFDKIALTLDVLPTVTEWQHAKVKAMVDCKAYDDTPIYSRLFKEYEFLVNKVTTVSDKLEEIKTELLNYALIVE
jgi:hypothetical protein